MALENCRRIQEDARWLHAAAEHLHRFPVVVQVMGLAGGHRHCQGVAVATPGAAYALDVVRGRGRHGTEDDAGKTADVHAEFQGRRRGKQVRIPGIAFVGGEALLQPVALLSRHQCRVLGGNDAPDVGVPVKPACPRGMGGRGFGVIFLGGQIEAGRALPQIRFLGGHHQRPPGRGAQHHGGL